MFVALSQQQQSISIIRNTTWILQGNTSDLFALKIKNHQNCTITSQFLKSIQNLLCHFLASLHFENLENVLGGPIVCTKKAMKVENSRFFNATHCIFALIFSNL